MSRVPPDLAPAYTEARDRQRFVRSVRAVYRLGDRAVFEMVDEIARTTMQRAAIEALAARFAAIDPAMLRAVGGDRFPPEPLRVVGGRG